MPLLAILELLMMLSLRLKHSNPLQIALSHARYSADITTGLLSNLTAAYPKTLESKKIGMK